MAFCNSLLWFPTVWWKEGAAMRAFQTPGEVAAARMLMLTRLNAQEDLIRQRVSALLDAFGVENEQSYRTDAGPADICCPGRRIIIETKRRGLAAPDSAARDGETPFEQLERYVTAERSFELSLLVRDLDSDMPWVGILTDGQVWHAWKWQNEEGAGATEIFAGLVPGSPEDLTARIGPVVARKTTGKPWVSKTPHDTFVPFLRDLEKIYADLKGKRWRDTETKRELWLDMLKTSGMAPETDAAVARLFTAHSFLITIARGVIHTLSSHESPNPDQLLSKGFVSWLLQVDKARAWAQGLLDDVHNLEWRRRRGDVLRPLYQAIVDEDDRRTFGEYYTPDWLAEWMVQETLDDGWKERAVRNWASAEASGVGVLDPACGSGTFLYHAAKALLNADAAKELGRGQAADAVAALVFGIDVHPIATEIARATVLRALPAKPRNGAEDIRIWQGDSLLARVDREDSLLRRTTDNEMHLTTPKGRELRLPKEFVLSRGFQENLQDIVDAANEGKPLPQRLAHSKHEGKLARFHRMLTKVIQDEGNSIWTWYITNVTAPMRLQERKVDRIVANPPWVAINGIQSEKRKKALEALAKNDLQIWNGGKQAPKFDIAQLFVQRCRQLYLSEGNPAGWLVKNAVLSGNNWEGFRQKRSDDEFKTVDWAKLRPFGSSDGSHCCSIVERRGKSSQIAVPKGRRLPKPWESIAEVMNLFDVQGSPRRFPAKQSEYLDADGNPVFRLGASLTPSVLVVLDKVTPISASGQVKVKTAKSIHMPWSDVSAREGTVPGHWVQSILGKDTVLPFSVAADQQAIVPTGQNGSLLDDPGAENDFWKDLQWVYDQYKGVGNSTPATLIGAIDYNCKLSRQLAAMIAGQTGRTKVICPNSGRIMRSARISVSDAIATASFYHWTAPTEAEAMYLVSLLNAPCLQAAFEMSRDTSRHFALHPWRKVPIPRYDESNSTHRALSGLCEMAEAAAQTELERPGMPAGQSAASSRIRLALAKTGILDRIDAEARKVLPDHSS